MPFPCQKGGMGVEMQVLVRISPILLFSYRFRVKPYPLKPNKGSGNLPLKDLVREPVCWIKMVHFWKPRKHAFWSSPVLGTLQYAPKAYPVKFYGLECWGWAVVGSDSYGPSVTSCKNRFSDSCRDKKAEAFRDFPAKRGSRTGPSF